MDRGQVWEAAEAGAAAILLIVAVLSDDRLHDLLIECLDCGLDPLVEVHDLDETRRACKAGCTLVGINNRDLITLEVDLETTDVPRAGPRPLHVPGERERHRDAGGRTPGGAGRSASRARRRDAGAHARRRPSRTSSPASRTPDGRRDARQGLRPHPRRGRPRRRRPRRLGGRLRAHGEPTARRPGPRRVTRGCRRRRAHRRRREHGDAGVDRRRGRCRRPACRAAVRRRGRSYGDRCPGRDRRPAVAAARHRRCRHARCAARRLRPPRRPRRRSLRRHRPPTRLGAARGRSRHAARRPRPRRRAHARQRRRGDRHTAAGRRRRLEWSGVGARHQGPDETA